MMAALAAEGYVNAALLTLLDKADFEAVDRLSTPEKYFVGLGVAHPELAVPRGTHEAASLVSLFRIRNQLTHSKAPEERALFPPRAEAGRWIGVIAKIVSSWPSTSGGKLSEEFSHYTAPFAKRDAELRNEDGERQLDALAGALDECSPFDIVMKPLDAPPGAISIVSTGLPPAPREPLWITHLDPDEPQNEDLSHKAMRD